MRMLLIAAVTACAGALYAGVPVDAQANSWIRICTNELTLAWDWDWEWVPSSAMTATVTAKDTGGGILFNQNISRPTSSVTWNLSNLIEPKVQSKRINVTLSFPLINVMTASRTATYELRQGSFSPRVRACETNSAGWRRFELPVTFDFDARWFRNTSQITYIQWKDVINPSIPLYPPPYRQTWEGADGFLTVTNGYLPESIYLASIHEYNTRLAQCEICNMQGMMIFIR